MNDYQNIDALEKSVANADTQLFSIHHKLHAVERSLDGTTNLEEIDDECVLELMQSMSEVNNEYQNLRKDLQEVQQMQRECRTSLRYTMINMNNTLQMLRKKIDMQAHNNSRQRHN